MTEPTAIITIFGSSRPHEGEPAYMQARTLGRCLAERGFVVCNGGFGGTMEATARGAKEAGGATIGVTCELFEREPNAYIDREIRMPRLTDRIIMLSELASGYVVLPGGTGTLLELAFVLEMVNKRFSEEKPVVLLGPFWTPILEPLKEEMRHEGLGNLAGFLEVIPDAESCAFHLHSRLLAGR